jgi:hypothetical protein
MGIFSDFANSAAGDLTIGAFEGLQQQAQKDVVVNATASNNALTKENEAYTLTETAFKNRKEIANILAANPDAFGLSSQEGLGIDQVADRFANFMFLKQRSMFENKDMDKVKLNVAKFMASNPGQGFDIYDPYIKGEDRFNQEKELHQARISEISKMPKADKLLMNIKEAEAEVATPEAITNELTKVSALTAKGFGILNTYPTSEAGMKNLHFVMTNIITSRAKAQFPNDAVARAEFIDQRLYDNNIDPTDGIMYSNNLNFRIMAKAIDTMGGANANKIAELTNAIAAAPDAETRKQLNDQLNTIVLDSHKIMNTYSSQAGSLMAGENRDQVFPTANTDSIGLPQVMDGYVPSIDNKGDLIIELANGNTQNIPLEVLVDSPNSIKLLPQVTQNYVNQVIDGLFVDGEMVEPKREDFLPGRAGDKAFKDFLGIYNIFFPDDSDDIFNEVETLEPTPKKKLTDADISQIKKDKTKDGNTIKVEELAPADTIIPKRKPDVPVKAEEPKEKTLQDKIQEDFGKPNVGISAGDATTKEDVKTDTQIQTEDVFKDSGVDPMFQSAKFNFKNVDKGYLVEQWNKNYQTDNSITNKFKANAALFFGSNDMPADAAKQIDQVASAFDGDRNFSKDQIAEILSAVGLLESKYKYKKQGLNKIDDGLGVARSYWQVEPSTAESILDENLSTMKGGGSPFLGANFEKLFRSKYADQIGSGTALEYFASLNRKELSDLLLKDGLFAASMAAHKVITTFDPFNSKGT